MNSLRICSVLGTWLFFSLRMFLLYIWKGECTDFFGARVSVPEVHTCFIIYIGLSLAGEKRFTEIDLLVIDVFLIQESFFEDKVENVTH